MSFRKILFVCAVAALGCAGKANAQLGVYGTVTGERLGGVKCVDPQGICASNDGTVRPYGGNFGVYYDFRNYGPVRVGLDVRGNVLNANKSANTYQGGTDLIRHYSFLGGVRGVLNTRLKYLQPYAEIAGGYARTNAAAPPPRYYENYGQVQALVGLDLVLFPAVDFRVLELGAGELFGPSSHSIQSIGVGIVFHTPRHEP